MEENKGHADGIKKSIEEIIGQDTTLKSKRPSEEDIQREKFEKLIITLEKVDIRTTMLGTEFELDLSKYNEDFYTIIDSLLYLHFGKEANELIFFYIYERMNLDGTVNELQDEEGNIVVLENPTDLWHLIKKVQGTKKRK